MVRTGAEAAPGILPRVAAPSPVEVELSFRRPAWARPPVGPAATPAPGSLPPAGGEGLVRALWTAWSAVDPRAAVREAVEFASAALQEATGEEPGWYALLRGLEMLGEQGPVQAGAGRHPTLRDAAAAQLRRFRSSPRLATLRARVEGGVPAARAALGVNPAYAPAQVALGRALLREGLPDAARRLLEAVEAPERVQGGAVALARARVETGDPGQALLAAARETNAPGPCGVEPTIHDPSIGHEVDEVRGLARLALGAIDAGARSLLRAASGGSPGARRALVVQAERAEVRQALARLSRDPALPDEARGLAGALAG